MAQTLPTMVTSAKGKEYSSDSTQGKVIVRAKADAAAKASASQPFSADSSALESIKPVFEDISGKLTSIGESVTDIAMIQQADTRGDALNKSNVVQDDLGDGDLEYDDGPAESESSGGGKSGGGFFSKLLGGAGAGAGLLLGGFGALMGGGALLLKEFNNFDGEKFKKNIESIMSIVPSITSPGAAAAFAVDTGMFVISMTAIGVGLAAFGIGSGVAGIADKFLGFDAQGVYDNVEILLGINNLFSNGLGALAEAGFFIVAMTALGAGLAVFGAGAAVGATGDAITQGIDKVTGESFAQNIFDNVKILLGINGLFGDGLGALAKAGTFFIAMTAIGAGLAVFGAGSAVGATADAMGQGIDKVTTVGWAQSIVDNVTTLLTINDLFGGTFGALAEGGTFFIAMTAIGAGLAVFGAGSAVGAAGDAIGQGASKVSEVGWAKSVVDNVTTLLGINKLFDGFGDALAEGGTFFVAMTAIAAGLAVFSVGAAVGGGVTGALDLTDWATRAEGGSWSQSIVDHVTTLLSIASLPNIGADVTKFALTMTGISAGLVAFGVGSFFATGADSLSQFVSGAAEGEGSWADKIKSKVMTLLSIINPSEGGATLEDANNFSLIMGSLSAGLMKFSGGTFVSSLLDVGSKVLQFLSGSKSPVTEMLNLASSADELTKGATALESLSASLEKISALKFDGSKINMKKFAQDLAESVPVIEKAIMGGSLDAGFFDVGEGNIKFKGLASPDVDFATAIQNIVGLRGALSGVELLAAPNGATAQLQNATAAQSATAGNATITYVNNDSSVKSAPTTTNLIEIKTEHDEQSQGFFGKALSLVGLD